MNIRVYEILIKLISKRKKNKDYSFIYFHIKIDVKKGFKRNNDFLDFIQNRLKAT